MRPIPLKDTQETLARVAKVIEKAIAHARERDIDEQQPAVARLSTIATQHRAAVDLATYAADAGGNFEEKAAIFAGFVVSECGRLARDFGGDHGLSAADLSSADEAFARDALADERICAIGRQVAEERGRNNAPLEEVLELTRDSVREFADAEIAPHAERIHRSDETVPEEFLQKMGELSYFGLSIPEEYGGSEMGNVAMVITTEELSRASLASAGSLVTRPEILAKALLAGGTEEQKKTWLPKVASGELMVGVAATEPDFGSDVAGFRCKADPAVVDGVSGYLINGAKAWCTFAGRANILSVLCRTDPDLSLGHKGLSMFIVPKEPTRAHEFECVQPSGGKLSGKADATPGYRGMHSYTLNFEDYFVPAENLIGGEAGIGRGFYLQMAGFTAGRLQTAGRACGVAQAALEKTAEYVVDRIQFGKPIIDFQLTQYKLGWMACQLAGARAISYSAAAAMDVDERAASSYASQAKLIACRVAVAVTQDGQLLHGGWGYAEEYPISRYVVDAQVLPIFEGVEPTLQLKVIGRALLAN